MRKILLTSMLLTVLAAGLLALPREPLRTSAATAAATYVSPRYRFIQANEAQGMSAKQLAADVTRLTALSPDFITYNELGYRTDAQVAPGKYDIWRKGGSVYRSETAVAWDSTKWTAVSKGLWMISDKTGKPAGQKLDWGVRYANWVTLKSKSTGTNVSVIAVHFAPDTAYTRGLAKPSAQRLTQLVHNLVGRGPVLVGGDLNVQYESSRWPGDVFAAEHLVTSYEATKKTLATNGKSTIDYAMARGIARFSTGNQQSLPTNSDHNALLVDFSPLPLATTAGQSGARFGGGAVVTDPGTTSTEEQTIVLTPLKAINSAPRGSSIHLATHQLTASRIVSALRSARLRGVNVQVLTAESTTTSQMRSLQALLGTNVKAKSWAVGRRGGYPKAGLPATALLIDRTGATPAFSFNSTSAMTAAANSGKRSGYLSVSKVTYDHFFTPFFAAVGRKV